MAGPGRPKGPGPSLRSRWLGEKLRALREEAGVSVMETAEFLQRDRSAVSRHETGEYPIRRADVYALLTFYGVEDEKPRSELLDLCEEVWRKGWWDPYREDVTRDFINLPWLESRTDWLCVYQNMLVHGLAQTPAYAEAVIRNAERGADEDQMQRWIDLRLERQRILSEDEPLNYELVLEEPVLHRPIGGLETMRGQLEHLLDLASRSNIDLRVMPTAHGPHGGHHGSFQLFVMPEQFPNVAYVETLGGALYVESPGVERFEHAWEDLFSNALDPMRSAALIEAALEETK
ncbi:helix-turn-helix domain-containing protein [Glycomyces arizonensis]|uniref:helix-turn-helix domain-containing protein n=1 Tax=Glycomyces arizonensis TaxID=256035 RepID=UPI0004293711|nr:helix-turn-helix transcriptional regulator [Glycomyces arizonensis]